MDDSTLKYSALVQEALAYKDSPIYRPTYYKINKTPTIPYEVNFKNDRKTLWTLFGILASVFFLTTLILMCLFVFKVYPIWGNSSDEKIIVYDKNAPVLFITGYPGSGMKYPRMILNTYDDVKCSLDEHIILEFLEKQTSEPEVVNEIKIGSSSGSNEIVDEDMIPNYSASFAYVMETLVSGSQPSKSLCSQVPYVLKHYVYMHRLLPNAKFLLVIRDPRGIAMNMAKQQKQESNSTFITELLQDWENSVDIMLTNCRELGPMECLPIYFEQLAIHPDLIMPRIDDFLGIPHPQSQRFEETFNQLDLDAWRENDVIRQINQSNDTLLQKLYGGHKYHQLKSEDLL